MEKEQYWSVILFLLLEGKSHSEIKERLDAVYGDSFPLMATVKNWFNELKRGRTSGFDDPRPGAPKTATTEDNMTKIHGLVLADRRLKIREIAETVGISNFKVFKNELLLSALFAVSRKVWNISNSSPVQRMRALLIYHFW